VVAGVIIIYALSPLLTALALALIPVYYAVFRATSGRLARASEEERQALSQAVESVKIGIDNMGFIRATLATDYFRAATERAVVAWAGRLLRLVFYRVFLNQTFNHIYSLMSLVMLIVGGYMAYRGFTTIGTVIAFTGVMYNLYEPAVNLSAAFAHVASWGPYLRRYREVLSLPVEDEDSGLPLGGVEHVRLDGVEVELGGQKVLKAVSLELKRGMVAGVVGPSGSGKTTLLLTLARLVEPSKGLVAVNGRDYRVYSLKSVRRRIRYVSPREPLISGSVFENVTMGLSEAEARKALRLCRVDFVGDLHDALGPGKLSEGQRQRLILARAVVSSPDVLLIDEALDAVDPVIEDAILSGLREELKDKIIVVVSHRASALRHADIIYVLDGGVIIDACTHEELYKRCDLYRELISRQKLQEQSS
jgi:ABC-type bacteriocin/lantibiotic exporters, contain an N-terminal double-glycine peptidase domain